MRSLRMGLAELDGARLADPATAMPVEELAEWVLEQRWFGSKAQEFAEFNVLDVVVLDDGPPLLAVMLFEARLNAGTHELYQLPIVTRAADDAPAEGVILERDGAVVCDALLDPRETARLGELMARSVTVERAESVVHFHWADGEPPAPHAEVRIMGVEQSNSSIVLDERFALKVFRRVEAGTNPELEMLSFLASHGFAHIAPLEGSYNYHGPLLDATLGVMQRYIPHA